MKFSLFRKKTAEEEYAEEQRKKIEEIRRMRGNDKGSQTYMPNW